MSPQNQRHTGLDKELLRKRKETIEQAKKNHPERWNGRKTRNLNTIEKVYLNPTCEDKDINHTKMEQAKAA